MGRAYEVRKASIQKTGAIKAKLYSMYAKEIYQSAKNGGLDPASNTSLKRLIDKAKANQVPSDIVKRAIDKVNSGIDENYTTLLYEGFGPGNSTILVEALTDNVNRAISNIRSYFTKCKSKLGAKGSVSYNYDHLCIISFSGLEEEAVLDALINAEIEINDIETEEGSIIIYGNPTDLHAIKQCILKLKSDVIFDMDEITRIAKERVTLCQEDRVLFDKLIANLDEDEDVQNVYYNVE